MEKITNAMPETEFTEIIEPMTLTCIGCGKEFILSEEEQYWYHDLEYALPKRCPECRKSKRSEKLRRKKERRAALAEEKAKSAENELVIRISSDSDPEKVLKLISDKIVERLKSTTKE
jgi:DNA-directed RNA polymerase subunit RPC12/RpoP